MAAFGVNDLVLTADLPYQKLLTFTQGGAAGDWTAFDVRMQVRHPYTNELLIELTPMLVPGATVNELILTIPGTLTGKLPAEGVWDILATDKSDPDVALRFPRPGGRFLVRRGVTQRV